MSILIAHSAKYKAEFDTLEKRLVEFSGTERVHSYEEASAFCADNTPEIIVCQATLLDGSAFDFVTRLRLLQDQQMVPVIVFSDQDNKKERIQTFQVGADDYLPELDLELMYEVIKREMEANRSRSKLESEKQQANELVMEVMKTSSELGNAITFIERCHTFPSNETIANELIEFCRGFQLKVVVGILEDGEWAFNASNGNVSDLEREVMQSLHSQDRFVDFGVRTQMNWPNIALLVKNMPLKEPERYGRIKDLLPTLLSSSNVRIHSLYEERRIQEQTDLMTRSIETLQPSIEQVIKAMHEDIGRLRLQLSDFLAEIITSLPKLGLEDDQEEFFINKVEDLIANADDMANRSEEHRETLNTTNRLLKSLLDKQHEIQALKQRPLEVADESAAEAELFDLF